MKEIKLIEDTEPEAATQKKTVLANVNAKLEEADDADTGPEEATQKEGDLNGDTKNTHTHTTTASKKTHTHYKTKIYYLAGQLYHAV